jgi:ABC-type branched-subunit amino acid transport system ATPase component
MSLDVHGVTVSYGGVHALTDLSFQLERGEIVGLIGSNGAGKTTAIDAITGYVRPTTGAVTLDGIPLDDLRAHRRARLGLARTFQQLELFEDLTVADNLRVAARSSGRDRAGCCDEAAEIVGIGGLMHHRVDVLPFGRRRLVAMARALAQRPAYILLDEPGAGLDSDESEELGIRMHTLRQRDLGVLLIDHDMGLVMSVCDRVIVLDFGLTIATGTPNEIRQSERVLSAYLGSE